jgi:hypothetical protein
LNCIIGSLHCRREVRMENRMGFHNGWHLSGRRSREDLDIAGNVYLLACSVQILIDNYDAINYSMFPLEFDRFF